MITAQCGRFYYVSGVFYYGGYTFVIQRYVFCLLFGKALGLFKAGGRIIEAQEAFSFLGREFRLGDRRWLNQNRGITRT